jgi:3-dehydroquinate synthase II
LVQIKNKELIIRPTVSKSTLSDFLSTLKGITTLNIDPKLVPEKYKFRTIFESEDADMIISRTIEELKKSDSSGKERGYFKKVVSNEDIDEITKASEAGAKFVVVNAANWKIIPLENIIASLHKSNTKIYATANNPEEVKTMFAILELGVDGVILSTSNQKEVDESIYYLQTIVFPVKPAKILEVRDVGIGERVCIDTTSILKIGEGMLIGSRSNFMFLIHNEAVGSSFTSPRPFRINAGAVYCYAMMPNGKTRYLSEIESGTEVLIVNKHGISRRATAGRSKIETRPLRLVKAEIDGEIGTVILQNAETIRFVTKDDKLLSVTDAKIGNEIMAYMRPPSGRHFGIEVEEYIVEK